MEEPQVPVGEPFSRVYLRDPGLLPDSSRFRIRLGANLQQLFGDDNRRAERESALREHLHRCGIEVPPGHFRWEFEAFFKTCPIRDALDTLTFVYEHFGRREYSGWILQSGDAAKVWLNIVRQIFAEEGLAYRADDACGIHPLVDAGFEHQRVAVLQGLSEARYKATRAYLEDALAAIEANPPNLRAGIKHAFEAAENLFMIFADKSTSLTANTVQSRLRPIIETHYASSDESQRQAASHMLNSFEHWVNAGHKYRHANKDTEPHEPTLDFAIAFVSGAMSYLRWLVSIDVTRRGAVAGLKTQAPASHTDSG